MAKEQCALQCDVHAHMAPRLLAAWRRLVWRKTFDIMFVCARRSLDHIWSVDQQVLFVAD